jgi:hypothetical protein
MPIDPPLRRRTFRWSAFHGRCRRRILAGLLLLLCAGGYAWYAGRGFGRRGEDARGFDRPLVGIADRLTPPPVHLASIQPQNNRELYLVTVVSDQQDVLFGLVLLVLRMIAALTAGGFGLVLLTAGSIEWEIRSEPPAS